MASITDSTSAGVVDSLSKERKPTTNKKGQLQVEDFIQMMVTQLQNQDPMEPAKNEQLLAQMSQIGQLQSQQQLQASLTTMVLQNNIGSASNLIGKTIEGNHAATGEKITGVVQSVRVEKGNVILELEDGLTLPMNNLTSISQPNADIIGAVRNSADAVAAGT